MADPSPSDRISAAFQKLAPISVKLNTASETLSKPVAQVEAALQKFNLGVASWTILSKEENHDGHVREWSVGYARHDGRWGILVKFSRGMVGDPDTWDEDTWFFADCPRFIKAKVVDALPELLEGIVAVADKTADKLARKAVVAQDLASAVTAHVERKK